MEYRIVDTFQNRLIEAIKISGLNQKDFSDLVGLSKSLINRYVHRGDNPKPERIIQIANKLQVNPLWLMGVDVPMNSIVTPKSVIYDIPVIKDITKDNLFAIKNYNGVHSNILSLDTDYQYFYYEEDPKRYLIQIMEDYKKDDVLVTLTKGKINLIFGNDIKDNTIIGKLISIEYKK